jgi:hypothetical protein
MKEGRWIRFIPVGNEYLVIAKEDEILLGIIEWFPKWRRYVFAPSSYTVFEQTCLRDIARFLDELREARNIKGRD